MIPWWPSNLILVDTSDANPNNGEGTHNDLVIEVDPHVSFQIVWPWVNILLSIQEEEVPGAC